MREIPKLRGVDGWKDIVIQESGDSLVQLHNQESILVDLQYFRIGVPGAIQECWVRKGVKERLEIAAKLLPDDTKLVVWDAWRPEQVQQSLLDGYIRELMLEYPNWSLERLIFKAQQFISLPSTDKGKPSPHLTGGSVDVSLCNESGDLINMGVPFDDFSAKAGTRFYETHVDEEVMKNRRLLFEVMTNAGFTNYRDEYWHFDYGNQFWAKATGSNHAIYGLIYP